MSTSPEAKQAAENERDPAEGRETGYYVQLAIDDATAKLKEEAIKLRDRHNSAIAQARAPLVAALEGGEVNGKTTKEV